MKDLAILNRIEIIDHTSSRKEGAWPRSFVKWVDDDFKVEFDIQDNGKTMKIFLSEA